MRNLFIIGNGFDCNHGFKTDYFSFKKYIKEHSFAVGPYNLNDFFDMMGENEWRCFEESLENYSFCSAMEFHSPVFSQNMGDKEEDRELSRGSSLYEDNVSIVESCEFKKALIYALNEFVVSATKKACNNNRKELFNRLFQEQDSFYISFNYSITLEKVYGIRRDSILYIHGRVYNSQPVWDHDRVWNGYEDPQLIFGHGGGTRRQEVCEYDPFKPHLVLGSLNTQLAKDYRLGVLKKVLLSEEIETLIILGHSLGEIDEPYFEEIARHRIKKVIYYLYNEMEEKEKQSSLKKWFRCPIEITYYD